MTETLETVEVETGPVERSVIWLHGLGANGHDFEPVVPELRMERTRFVFPHAPSQPVTINMGMVMPAWYDIVTLEGPLRENLDDVKRSAKRVEVLIARENERGIPTGRITLAGFSQGGAMALYVGLRYPVALQGIMVLSAYILDPEGTPAEAAESNRATPMFFAHGRQDMVVPFDGGKRSCELVHSLDPKRDLQWREYAMGHEVCLPEIKDISQWLRGLP